MHQLGLFVKIFGGSETMSKAVSAWEVIFLHMLCISVCACVDVCECVCVCVCKCANVCACEHTWRGLEIKIQFVLFDFYSNTH